jgi:hypothetical protein
MRASFPVRGLNWGPLMAEPGRLHGMALTPMGPDQNGIPLWKGSGHNDSR